MSDLFRALGHWAELLALVYLFLLFIAWWRKRGGKDSYAQKLKDPRWKSLRRQVLELHGHKCLLCGKKAWQVHHQFYVRGKEPWEYDIEDLTPLCGRCHQFYEWGKKRLAS